MNKEALNNIRLGIFVITGTVLLIIGLYLIGSNRNIFGKTFTVYATFRDVNGLLNGNNVRFAGIKVGTVDKVEIVNDTTVKVKMTIEKKMLQVIKKNSMVSIGTDGLMGDKLINIEAGTPDAAFIEEGDELASIPSLNMDEMLRTLDITNKNVAIISTNLKNITQNISEGRGTLYTVLNDTTIAAQLRHTLKNIDVVSNNILQISADLNAVVSEAKNGKGLLGTLVKDTVMTGDLGNAIKEIKTAGEQINTSAGELKIILNKVNTGSGTISTLINDTASANNLKRSLVNIDSSAQKLPALMEALKHNFLFKAYFKKQEKQNKK
ncbi:MAG: MCE family protein [Chitinophagales bacterium]|nr:MCE family protein [Chitinophagales bacterium]